MLNNCHNRIEDAGLFGSHRRLLSQLHSCAVWLHIIVTLLHHLRHLLSSSWALSACPCPKRRFQHPSICQNTLWFTQRESCVHMCGPHTYVYIYPRQLVYRPYLRDQFAMALDVYLEMDQRIADRVKVVLARHEPDWRIKNACPACNYEVRYIFLSICLIFVISDAFASS